MFQFYISFFIYCHVFWLLHCEWAAIYVSTHNIRFSNEGMDGSGRSATQVAQAAAGVATKAEASQAAAAYQAAQRASQKVG